MTHNPYITCRELIEFLGDYLSGELPASAHAEVDRHLAVCASCVAYLEGYKRTIAMGKDAMQNHSDQPTLGQPPQALLKALHEALSKAKP